MQNNSGPKRYSKPMPILWWTRRWVDIRFITRELTSVFVAGYSIVLLLYIRSISQGAEAHARFSESLTSPTYVGIHIFALIALIYHSITWFNLAPKAMVIKLGDHKVPGILIALMNYAGWAAVSVVIVWLATQG